MSACVAVSASSGRVTVEEILYDRGRPFIEAITHHVEPRTSRTFCVREGVYLRVVVLQGAALAVVDGVTLPVTLDCLWWWNGEPENGYHEMLLPSDTARWVLSTPKVLSVYHHEHFKYLWPDYVPPTPEVRLQ